MCQNGISYGAFNFKDFEVLFTGLVVHQPFYPPKVSKQDHKNFLNFKHLKIGLGLTIQVTRSAITALFKDL